MSRIIIVDENDTPIGLKERGDMKEGDIYRVSAIWITNSRGDILLAQRAATKKHDPNKWACAVAGTIEEGEEYLTNAVKEAEEEIGLVIEPHDLALGIKTLIQHSPWNFFCQWFWYRTNITTEDLRLTTEEVAAVRWVSPEELRAWVKERPQDFVGSTSQWIDEVLVAQSHYFLDQPRKD